MEQQKVRILLVEDNSEECRAFESCAAEMDDMEIVGITGSATEAMDMMNRYRPNGLILDLELQEGDGIEFYDELLRKYPLNCPFTVVTTNITCGVTLQGIHDKGAGFVFPKSIKKYSAEQVLRQFKKNKRYILSKDNHFGPPANSLNRNVVLQGIRYQLTEDLGRLGITSKMKGHKYLVEAALVVREDTGLNYGSCRRLFQMVADIYGTDWRNVERDIRSAIDTAWSIQCNEFRDSYYTQYINPETGKPTCIELVTFLANKY